VAHEEGELNDIRAILGNDEAIKSYREGKLPAAKLDHTNQKIHTPKEHIMKQRSKHASH
jgi:hypothetical protein